MGKNLSISIRIVCLAFWLLLLGGCQEQSAPPPKAKEVRQKIGAATSVESPAGEGGSTAASPTTAVSTGGTAASTPVAAARTESKPGAAAAPTPTPIASGKASSGQTVPVAAPSATPVVAPPPPSTPKPITDTTAAGPVASESESPKTAEAILPAASSLAATGTKLAIRLDPFEPLFRDEAQPTATTPKQERPERIPMTPLEKIDINQLKLVGIIRSAAGNKALVEEASGKGYIITSGTYIGLNSGQVKQILPDRILIEEPLQDLLGKTTITKRELKLQKPFGED